MIWSCPILTREGSLCYATFYSGTAAFCAGMVRFLYKNFLQDGGGLELVGVGLVAALGRGIECQGIEDRCLAVVRVACVQALHGLLVGQGTRAVIALLPILIERLDGG